MRGWTLGAPITSNGETRAALTHIETKWTGWVYGDTLADRIRAAKEIIDTVYQGQWDELADLIEAGDWHGPNVKSLVPLEDALGPDA